MLFYLEKKNGDAEKKRGLGGGGGAVQRPGGKKREVMLQLERTRGWKGNKKGQHQLTDVIRNDGNMARTASLSLSLPLSSPSHTNTESHWKLTYNFLLHTNTHFPSSCGSVHWGISTGSASPGCRLK